METILLWASYISSASFLDFKEVKLMETVVLGLEPQPQILLFLRLQRSQINGNVL